MRELVDLSKRFLFLLALSLVVFSFLPSPGPLASEISSEDAVGIIKGKTNQGYPFMSGGIGADERQIMEESGKSYNLKLSFAEKSGQYLSGVEVVIADEKGKEIARTTVHGPWFYIQLPAGKYSIRATLAGATKRIKDLDVPAKQRVFRLLHWDLKGEG
ncbi:MAG: carboxypeptidase regulatory-like domain-containing protein [Deltaproteobacteria bacterium]|nr:carboxypeptidase regulatory-like domain-containing protein [Deltaproteobacteria bacterium]